MENRIFSSRQFLLLMSSLICRVSRFHFFNDDNQSINESDIYKFFNHSTQKCNENFFSDSVRICLILAIDDAWYLSFLIRSDTKRRDSLWRDLDIFVRVWLMIGTVTALNLNWNWSSFWISRARVLKSGLSVGYTMETLLSFKKCAAH